ncbi:MAG: hypothetical protein ACE37B_20760 [Ilumatobacter sp.]|jgi:hypothetical protein|uniref:hypothetical protein n=1 Tax=Ilumatobacter sp. TaxID=1967498 RepID=UPI00391D1376
MGLFKQMKQAKDAVAAAPDLIQNAQAMQQAQIDAAHAQQAAAAAAANAAAATGGGDFEPIAGVSIELYADISRALNDRGGDQALAPVIAAEHGVDQASWDEAVAGWNARMQTNPTVGTRFGALWRGVG